jgi:hypothetical protein
MGSDVAREGASLYRASCGSGGYLNLFRDWVSCHMLNPRDDETNRSLACLQQRAVHDGMRGKGEVHPRAPLGLPHVDRLFMVRGSGGRRAPTR